MPSDGKQFRSVMWMVWRCTHTRTTQLSKERSSFVGVRFPSRLPGKCATVTTLTPGIIATYLAGCLDPMLLTISRCPFIFPLQAAKVICSAKISSPGANGDLAPAVNQADFCPSDASLVCVTGDKILRFFRVADAQFKPLPLNLKMELQVYTAHCWLGDEQARSFNIKRLN